MSAGMDLVKVIQTLKNKYEENILIIDAKEEEFKKSEKFNQIEKINQELEKTQKQKERVNLGFSDEEKVKENIRNNCNDKRAEIYKHEEKIKTVKNHRIIIEDCEKKLNCINKQIETIKKLKLSNESNEYVQNVCIKKYEKISEESEILTEKILESDKIIQETIKEYENIDIFYESEEKIIEEYQKDIDFNSEMYEKVAIRNMERERELNKLSFELLELRLKKKNLISKNSDELEIKDMKKTNETFKEIIEYFEEFNDFIQEENIQVFDSFKFDIQKEEENKENTSKFITDFMKKIKDYIDDIGCYYPDNVNIDPMTDIVKFNKDKKNSKYHISQSKINDEKASGSLTRVDENNDIKNLIFTVWHCVGVFNHPKYKTAYLVFSCEKERYDKYSKIYYKLCKLFNLITGNKEIFCKEELNTLISKCKENTSDFLELYKEYIISHITICNNKQRYVNNNLVGGFLYHIQNKFNEDIDNQSINSNEVKSVVSWANIFK